MLQNLLARALKKKESSTTGDSTPGMRRGTGATRLSVKRQAVSYRYAYSAIEKKRRRRKQFATAVLLALILTFPLTGFVRAVQHESVRQEEILRNPLVDVAPDMKMALNMPEITRRRARPADGFVEGHDLSTGISASTETTPSETAGTPLSPLGPELLALSEETIELGDSGEGIEAQDSRHYPETLSRFFDASGRPSLELDLSRAVEVDGGLQIADAGLKVDLSLSAELQKKAEGLLKQYRVPWGGVVLMKPQTGEVLAIASHSSGKPDNLNFALNAKGPAASIFKLVTASAALENTKLNGNSPIRYRGGDYVLNQRNYNPQAKLDTRSMPLATALGKSCNPVFARVALNYLSPELLERYARSFAFGRELGFDIPARQDTYVIPKDDYGVARTAAGFGEVTLNPLHAASLMGSIANKGVMMRPYIVETLKADGTDKLFYKANPQPLQQVLKQETAGRLLDMMEETTRTGTGRREFRQFHAVKDFPKVIAAKTGTLTGKEPLGVYFWFVAAAPAENPEIVVASLVVDQGKRQINASALARLMLEEYYRSQKNA